MKKLEKIAIDAIITDFVNSKTEMIEATIEAKAAAELAQQNFKKVAGPLISHAKEAGNLLLEDEVSDEAMAYFEQRFSELVKIPFTLRK
jgi:hypothetical protein